MKCKAVRKRLAAYIDGELERQTAQTVKTHLGLCSMCSLEYDRLKKALRVARVWQRQPLPEGFVAGVQERAERGERPRVSSVWPIGAWPLLDRVPRRAWLPAAACVVFAVGLVLGHLVCPRHVEVAGPARNGGAREGALATLATLQKVKLVLGMRQGTEHMIAEHSAMQRQLAEAIGPEVAAQVAAYHEAEALLAEGRLDEASAILDRLESADPPFVLAPYVPITRLAAQAAPYARSSGRGIYAELLMPEVLASPERFYEAVASQSRRLARLYTEALEESLVPFERLGFPKGRRWLPGAPE